MRRLILFFSVILFSINNFAQPVITSFTPSSGNVGTSVVIKGSGFSTSPSNNIVYFGAVKATTSDAADTTITVAVPIGATYGPITVTTNNLTAYSSNAFITTFATGGGAFTPTSFLPKIDSAAGIYPHSISVADFDGDGKSDLLVSRGSSNTVSIFKNTSNGSISFAPTLNIAANGNNHEGCAVGDLDGDGKLDFVITNSIGLHSVSIYRNTSSPGNISFASKIDSAADNSPYSVAIGDLNGDGKPDLAIANNGSNNLTFYINSSSPGNISFQPKINTSVGTNPYGVAIGDLDNDGKAEVAFTTQGSSSALAAMKNTSSGGVLSFDPPVEYTSLPGPFTVSIGDLNGDDFPELVAASSGAGVLVIQNVSTQGNLSFGSLWYLPAGNYPVCVSISDVNGDGNPDLVASNRFSNNVSVIRNTSTLNNFSFDSHVDYAVNDAPIFVAVGDLDGDQRPDIIAGNSSANNVSILGNIIGANVAPVIDSFTPTSGISGTLVKIKGSNFTGATAVNFGGTPASSFIVDSATGITAIVGIGSTGDVSVTTSYGTATLAGFTFSGPTITSFSPTIGITGTVVTIIGTNFTGATSVQFGGVAAVSFTVNSSTTITATVGNGSSGSITVTTSNGTAALAGFSYGAPTITSFTPASGPVGTLVTITGTNFSSTAEENTVFFGAVKATVSFATSNQLNVIVPAGCTYQPITITSGNLTAYSSNPFIVTFPNDSLKITDSSFSVVANYGSGTYPADITVKDLNDDGKPDLITANAVSNNISILKNSSTAGSISFTTKFDIGTGGAPRRVTSGDLDGDGKPDLVVANGNSGNASTISVLRNSSSGGTISFAPKVDYSSGNGTYGLSVADMNGDGKPDIMTSSGNSGIFSYFQNTTVSVGTISFATRQDFTLLTHADYLAIADLDQDGRPDLITSNFSNSSISVFRNTSATGIFSLDPRIDYAVGTNPSYLSSGDMDGDGKLDLVVLNYSSGNVSFFKNNSIPGIISLGKQDYNLNPTNVAFGDLNGDGKLDLCTGNALNGVIYVLENTYPGTGSFSFGSNIQFTTGAYDTFVATGDLDGDGKPELAVANTIPNTVTILRNKMNDPVITGLSASSAVIAENITITGSRLADATSVEFGGTPADSFSIVSASRIDAVVGGGASGNITVKTPHGTAAYSGFKFIPEISAGGPTTFCGDGFVLLTSTATANNQWYKDGTIINGATNNSLQAIASGLYSAKTTSNGITTSSTGITVTAISTAAPVISVNAAALVSSAATGNQWYLNGNLIVGATGQTYQPTESGNYSVVSTVNGCVSDASSPYNFILSGIVNLGNDQYLNFYPNPVKDKLYVDWNINNTSSLNFEVVSLQGKQVLINKNVGNGSKINLSKLPQGMYLIKIYNSTLTINKTVKVIKAN
ncbi:MAG TPA: FG-GAP-like repeat-containing protein [Chitinophagaceae bacterium]|jgi:hypothetical protein|nr:FG-GAP-like repeat-containing protein [Chitinophagaceae bacterium]